MHNTKKERFNKLGIKHNLLLNNRKNRLMKYITAEKDERDTNLLFKLRVIELYCIVVQNFPEVMTLNSTISVVIKEMK